MTIRGSTSASSDLSSTGATGLQSSRTYQPRINSAITWTDGTGAGQINKLGSALVGTPGGNVDVDLSGGSHLVDGNGAAVTFTAIKTFTIRAPITNEEPITIGNGSNDWVGAIDLGTAITLPPGAVLHMDNPSAAGWPVVNGSSDIVRVAVASATEDVAELIFAGI